MEKQTGFLGISTTAWGVVGMLSLAIGALVLCALVVMMFGLDIGKVVG
ncbi:MAG: hypothetical protein KAT58_09430 [candidate division Zixibacteria bacterium]|nr:hypothetical protein [candidate division Zixibacteria bacterium]